MYRWLLGIGVVALAVWVLIRRAQRRAYWGAQWREYENQPYD